MKNTKIFTEEANRIHEGFYDYSKVNYVGARSKVEIICPIHGSFWKMASQHVRLGQAGGCPKCGWQRTSRKLMQNKERFVEDARKIHGDRYNYDKVVYIGKMEKVCITCKIHGDFWQAASNHVARKSGCPSCAGQKKYDRDVISERAKKIYGNKFDCSEVEVGNELSMINVKCPKHGIIRVMAMVFLRGKTRCPDCERERKGREFIEKATVIHGGIYDYSRVKYVDIIVKVEIICKKHGIFKQDTGSHLNGSGCPKCFGDRLSLTNEEFTRRARLVHGLRYDYSKVEYLKCHDKVVIICHKHGAFLQAPTAHLLGHGCQKCFLPRSEENVARVLDSLGEKYERQKKFPECRDKKVLSYDFYLPLRRILIEADGLHHFLPVSFSKGGSGAEFKAERFASVKRRDHIKNEFAKTHGFELIRLPHWILYRMKEIKKELVARLSQ